MTDELYVVRSFIEHFSCYKDKKIVIYGKGPKTKQILDACPDYNIEGLMDGTLKGGYIHNKKILSPDEVAVIKPDIVVVVAKVESTAIVYQRIGKFCYDHAIPLYGINGKNLYEYYGVGEFHSINSPYFLKSEEELKAQIRSHEIISFDIFDTLIMRKTFNPLDVFEIVGSKARRLGLVFEDFFGLRRKAEMENPIQEVNLYEIYDEFQRLTGITDAQKEQLCNLEIEVEKQVLIQRAKMVEIFEYAKRIGKKVYLISDMYLPQPVIEEILTELGIQGYEKLYLSNTLRQAKWSGLFKRFKEEVPGESYLHIGDNEDADGNYGSQAGLDVYLIKKAVDMLELSSYAPITRILNNTNGRSLVGLFIARVFNDPFILGQTDGRPGTNAVEDMGYLFTGALLTTFILWIVECMKKGDYEDILLSARDGYLLIKLYRFALDTLGLEKLPRGIYFQTSRKVCAAASMDNEIDIGWLSRVPTYCSYEKMMHERFEIPEAEVLPYDWDHETDVFSYALKHKDKIYRSSRRIRMNYWKYMEQIGLHMGSKYAFLDFCATGTCQYFLGKIAPYELHGLYFCRYFCEGNIVNQVSADGLFKNYAFYATESYFYEHYLFLETIMTSFEPTLVSFDGQGNPVYGVGERSKEQLQYVKDMHEAIKAYFEEYVSCLYVPEQEIDKEIADRLFSFMGSGYTRLECEALNHLELEDGLGRGSIKIPKIN